MKRGNRFGLYSLGLSAALLLASSAAFAQGPVQRFSARFLKFDNTEFVAQNTDTAATDGIGIYANQLKIPAAINVLFVHLAGTADVNGANVSGWFTCKVDNDFCNGGSPFATGTPGWISLIAGDNDTEHDLNVNYTWCVPIKRKPGANGLQHKIELRMASNGAGNVYLEAVHVYVDGAKMTNSLEACTKMIPD